jgi:hypothetical protein
VTAANLMDWVADWEERGLPTGVEQVFEVHRPNEYGEIEVWVRVQLLGGPLKGAA